MGAGKALAIIAGILVIVATFITSWFTVLLSGSAYGIGLLKNLTGMFTNADALGVSWGVPSFVSYILGGMYILFLISWIFILIGAILSFPLTLCHMSQSF